MDCLHALQLEILNRLDDPIDLVRCRLVSKTLNTISYNVRSLNIICSKDRFLKYRAALESNTQFTPFKSVVKKLILNSRNLEIVCIGLDDSLDEDVNDNIDSDDDLYLMDDDFVSEWLPQISPRLKSISISSFDVRSRWRVSKILSLISSTCQNLVELTLRNAYLSVEGLEPMLTLTSLTLERIKLDDEGLNMVNKCFPSLRALGLIDVKGLREPSIHFLHLQTCTWKNSQRSLTINAPNLTKLKLHCSKTKTLVLKAPLLSTLKLSFSNSWNVFEAQNFPNLKTLSIASCNIHNHIKLFPECNAVEKLELISLEFDQLRSIFEDNVTYEKLVTSFPNVIFLRVWLWGPPVELGMDFVARGTEATNGWKSLKHLRLHVDSKFAEMELETRRSFISSLLEQCGTFSKMRLVCRRMPFDAASQLISSFIGDLPWSE